MMTVVVDAMLDHEALHLDPIRFVRPRQASRRTWRWDAVIADQWIGEDQNLTGVRWIGQRLDIARHPGVEHNLAANRARGAKRIALEDRAVVQRESRSSRC